MRSIMGDRVRGMEQTHMHTHHTKAHKIEANTQTQSLKFMAHSHPDKHC